MEAQQLIQKMREVRGQYRLSATAQALFTELVTLFGESGFPEELRIENKVLYLAIDISENTLKKVRNELMSAKLLIYVSEKAKKLFGVYTIPDATCTAEFEVQKERVIICTSNSAVQAGICTSKFEVKKFSTADFEVEKESDAVCTANFEVQTEKRAVCTSKFADSIRVYTSTDTVSISSPNGELVENRPVGGVSTSEGLEDVSGKVEGEDAAIPSFKTIGSDSKSIGAYIAQHRPKSGDAYFAFWNLFAAKFGLPKLQEPSPERRRKVRTRVADKAFDFVKLLTIASKSALLLESTWFSFDWLVKNETNFRKVLEGNYSRTPQKQSHEPKPQLSAQAKALQEHIRQQSA